MWQAIGRDSRLRSGRLIHAALRERAEPGVIIVECSTLSDTDRTWAVVTIGDESITALAPRRRARNACPAVRRMARRSRPCASGGTPRDRGAWRCRMVGARATSAGRFRAAASRRAGNVE